MKPQSFKLLLIAIASLLLVSGCASMNGEMAEEKHHKLVIQVSSADQKAMSVALNNAVNVQKEYGIDNIDIEIVAYGPGLQMLTAKHKLNKRVSSLAQQNITFSACNNTMHVIAKKSGKKPKLTEGVTVVSAGVSRIIELQEAGYSYIRP